MKKQVLALLLAAVMLMAAVPAVFAADTAVTSGKCGANVTWKADTATKTITISGTGPMYDYDVDETPAPWVDLLNDYYDVDQDKVTSKAACDTVVIEPGVTSVGDGAFSTCGALVSVTIPDGVTRIGREAFDYCAALASVELPDSLTSIGSNAFVGCGSLTSINIPSSVTAIEEYAFWGCYDLSDVYYGGSEEQWGKIACIYIDWDIETDEELLVTQYFAEGGQETVGLDNVTVHYSNTPVEPAPGPVEPDPQPAPAFPDVPAGAWYAESVNYVVTEGLMKGTGDGNFTPGKTITRAEIFIILARKAGVDTDGGANWYEKATAWAVEAGMSDGTNPTTNITREQLAVMLYRQENSPAVDLSRLDSFPDVDSIHNWTGFPEAMAWAVANGIINGTGDGRLNPLGNATRAETAKMIESYCKLG